ncbi:MAG: GNAT family N-acetyltransferase [Fibrobacteria bacterium]
MMNSITVLPANLEHPESCEAILRLIEMYAQDPMGGGHALSPLVRENMIAGLKSHPTTRVFLAYAGERAIGVAVCFLGFSTFAAKPLLNVHDLAVEPEFRGRGVGKMLLAEVERKARELGCCKLTLEVLEFNETAVRTYKSFGFDPGQYAEETGRMLLFVKPL